MVVIKIMTEKDFSMRLAQLREEKGVSARDMSLSMGQNPGYINNIENGVNLPSMSLFFYICDYFGITPLEFFDMDNSDPAKIQELVSAAKGLNSSQLEHVIAIINDIKK